MRKINRNHLIFYLICLVWLFFFLLGCSKKPVEVVELKHYPVYSLEGVISRSAPNGAVKRWFFLKEGENPDNIKLNLVINGKGTVWIDDIRLVKGRLP